MLKKYFLIIAILFVSLLSCEKEQVVKKVSGKNFASSLYGLVLRAEPSVKSGKIMVIPYGAEVRILKYDSKRVTIDNTKGRWAYIDYNGSKGWAFDGFIKDRLLQNNSAVESFFSNPFAHKKKYDDKKRILSEFGQGYSLKEKKTKNPHNDKDTIIYYQITYPGIEFVICRLSDGREMTVKCVITGNREAMKLNVRIGGDYHGVIDTFGYPAEFKDSTIRYYPGEYWGSYVDFTLKDGKISSVGVYNLLD